MLIGFFCIPIAIEQLGRERFGILTIIWMIVGYFSIFDFGLGRNLTKIFSSSQDALNLQKTFWTFLRIAAIIAITIGVLISILAAPLTDLLFNPHDVAPAEIRAAILIIGLSIPFVIFSTLAKGALEGIGEFTALNIIQILFGSLTFFLAVVFQNLVAISIALFSIRLVLMVVQFFIIFRKLPHLKSVSLYSYSEIRTHLTEGGWMTLSQIVGPIMVYFDRFFLSAMIPAQQIAFYTTPFEAVSKIQAVPSSISRAAYPVFCQDNPQRLRTQYMKSLKLLFITTGLPMVIGFAFAIPILNFWIGAEFAAASSPVFSILCLGFLINSFGWLPLSLLQAKNKSSVPARIHLFELFLYLPLLYFLIQQFGFLGAAIAWTLRVTLDTLLLLYFTHIRLRLVS